MPVYSYQCENTDCTEMFERSLPISEYAALQSCPVCDSATKKMITSVGFILKGDDWVGKNLRIKKQMSDKNRRLAGKENEMKRDAPAVTLAPNVDGERVANWSEAKKLAESKGKDTSSYDKMVRKERRLA